VCAGCVQSGLEFATANAVVLGAGVRQAGGRLRDRIRPSVEPPAARRARREAEVAAFLEGLDLDAATILGRLAPPVAVVAPTVAADEFQPA